MILQILKDWALIVGTIVGCIGGFALFIFGGLKLQEWIDTLEETYQWIVIILIVLVSTLGFAVFMAYQQVPK